MQGLYTVRATVSDGPRSSTVTETFSFVPGGVKPAEPVLDTGDPVRRPASQGVDRRACRRPPRLRAALKRNSR